MTQDLEGSKRIKALRRAIVQAIPRFPNNKASKQAMEAKHLTDLLISYIGWRLRYVATRRRKVIGHERLAEDKRSAALQTGISAFLKAVEAGDDLTPYLSLLPHSQGYTPVADAGAQGGDSWADKDFLLNVMGLHHFHLGLTKESKGHIARTNEVLFASVTRDSFEILGLFDHAAFESDPTTGMTPERQKLWSVFESQQKQNALPGQPMIGGYGSIGITLSSHPVSVVLAAQRHVRIMQKIDPKLNDPAYVKNLYGEAGVPAKPKLCWHYNHLDLGLLDEKADFFRVLAEGPN